MSFRTFFIGLTASFGIAWLAIIVVPYFKMRSLEPMMMGEEEIGTNKVYIPKRPGRIADGSQIYAENGCYQCHSQLIRPTYAGNELFRPDWGGYVYDDERGDTRRETNAFDFSGEKFAQIGVARMGPDLSNLALRVKNDFAEDESPEEWLYKFLYDPRRMPKRHNSACPSFRFLFEEREVRGMPSDEALPFRTADGEEIVPKPAARALVSYLLSLKKDQAVPSSLDFGGGGAEKEGSNPAP